MKKSVIWIMYCLALVTIVEWSQWNAFELRALGCGMLVGFIFTCLALLIVAWRIR